MKNQEDALAFFNFYLQIIGTFAPGLLRDLLPQFAVVSGFEDTRFSPIQLKEVSDLSVGVSLLGSFITCTNLYDWELGKHGVRIQFEDQSLLFSQKLLLLVENRQFSGTFLPEVAIDWKWTKEDTIQQLLRKAGKICKVFDNSVQKGFKGKLDEIKNTNLSKYETHKCWLSYDQYLKMGKSQM